VTWMEWCHFLLIRLIWVEWGMFMILELAKAG
jgi:hypothetical protein